MPSLSRVAALAGCENTTSTAACGFAAARFSSYAGSDIEDFAWRLHHFAHNGASRREPVRILVLGNSVARWNKFLASHTFRRVLHGAFPSLTFEVSTGSVEGGFGPSHQLYCGRNEWKDAAIILVHFAELASGRHGHDLLQQLIGLPHRPLVVVIKHCSLPQLETLVGGGVVPNSTRGLQRSLWFRRDKHHTRMQRDAEGVQQGIHYVADQARFEQLDTALARSMNATLIDSCDLLRSMLPPPPPPPPLGVTPSGSSAVADPCSRGSSYEKAFESLATRMFPFNAKVGLGDPLHPTPEYSELQVSSRCG